MEKKRLAYSIKLIIAITVLSVLVFTWNYFRYGTNYIPNFISGTAGSSGNTLDNYNGIYTYNTVVEPSVNVFMGCTVSSIQDYILVKNDVYYLFRSSCMGAFKLGEGKTDDLNIIRESAKYYISYDNKRFDKDITASEIDLTNVALEKGLDKLNLEGLDLFLKETEYSGQYYNLPDVSVASTRVFMVSLEQVSELGEFQLKFHHVVADTYPYALYINDFNNVPWIMPFGENIVIIKKDNNPNDILKYGYQLIVFNKDGVHVNSDNYFPIYVNDVRLDKENYSVYFKFDNKNKKFIMLIGKNKNFCIKNSDSKDIAYYEFQILYDYGSGRFQDPEFVKWGTEDEGCNYVNSIMGV